MNGKRIKGIVSAILAVVMIASFSLPAFAAEGDVVEKGSSSKPNSQTNSQSKTENEITFSDSKTSDVQTSDDKSQNENDDKAQEAIDTEGKTGDGDDDEKINICDEVGELLETEEHIVYIKGYNERTFAPDSFIKRSEAAQMFYNLLKEEPEGLATFPDVNEESWMGKPIGALAYLGAIKGMPNGDYKPDSFMTRAEFVTIAARFATLKTGENKFRDVEEGSWCEKYVISGCEYGWIEGFDNGTFRPDENVTRAQAVTIINRMLNREADPLVKDISFVKRFDDVSEKHWAFKYICEAATEHKYTHNDSGKEVWLVKEDDVSHWDTEEILDEEGNVIGEEQKYFDAYKQEYASGFFWLEDRSYYFDPETNFMKSGWLNINGYDYLVPDRDTKLYPFDIGQYITKVNYREANRTADDIKYITVHYTAIANDTAYGDCAAFYNTYRAASAQYFVDENSVWQCVKDKDVSWHVGNDVYYHEEARNENTVSIEMCCKKVDMSNTSSSYDKDWYLLSGTEENSANLVRGLMMKYGVPIQNVIRHSDVTHKVCPAMYVQDYQNWRNYLDRVTKYEISYNGDYKARITTNNVVVRSGPDKTYPEVRKLSRNDVVTIIDEKLTRNTYEDRWAKIGENEWISFPNISRI